MYKFVFESIISLINELIETHKYCVSDQKKMIAIMHELNEIKDREDHIPFED